MTVTSSRTLLLAAGAMLIGSSLAGCTKPPTEEEKMIAEVMASKDLKPATEEEKAAIRKESPVEQAKFWGRQFDLTPNNKEIAVEYANSLRMIRSHRKASEIAAQALAIHPDDVELAKILAKTAMDQGRADAATNVLFQALSKAESDWDLHSLYGVALDQIGEHEQALEQYDLALAISPDNALVVTNKALSLAMDGKAEQGEALLRAALAQEEERIAKLNAEAEAAAAEESSRKKPGKDKKGEEIVQEEIKPETVDPRIRQNLAMLLGIQGKFEEAREMTSKDLPPITVAANMDYYRNLLTPQRNYDALRGADANPTTNQ